MQFRAAAAYTSVRRRGQELWPRKGFAVAGGALQRIPTVGRCARGAGAKQQQRGQTACVHFTLAFRGVLTRWLVTATERSGSSGLNQSVPGAQAAQRVRSSGSNATETCLVPSP